MYPEIIIILASIYFYYVLGGIYSSMDYINSEFIKINDMHYNIETRFNMKIKNIDNKLDDISNLFYNKINKINNNADASAASYRKTVENYNSKLIYLENKLNKMPTKSKRFNKII